MSDIVITVDKLTVWTPEERSWWRNRVTKKRNVLIDNVSAVIKQGDFVAVIGPSGAGKTTFLVSLAGKTSLPLSGEVKINGQNVKDLNVIEIMPQNEVFVEALTVSEHLVFMIEMKLGSIKCESNKLLHKQLLNDLRLKHLTDSLISSLSGGERRLLSLATSLISNPHILVTDEPTTGLDSYNAVLVITALKKLSETGKIVICSIHQPSSEAFEEFSSVMLMADGKLIFHGNQEECCNVFQSINLHIPANYNPAEFYVRAVSASERCVEKVMEIYKNRSFAHQTSLGTLKHIKMLQRNWFVQVYLLLWRLSLTIRRNVRDHVFQLFISIMASSLIVGTCYVGISGTTQRGVQDIRGLLWLIVSELCFSISYSALYIFQYEIPLFKREAGMYKCSAYYVARFLSCIPRCILWSVTQIIIISTAVQLPNHIVTSLEFVVALIVAGFASIAYGLGMSALFTSSGMMGDIMPCADLPLFLMSGAFLRISSLPPWLSPIKFISHFYYSMDAVSNVYWRNIEKIDCPWNSTSVCYKDGESVLFENGYSNDYILQDGLGLLFVTTLWSLLSYLGLKREEKKGYAY